MVQVSRQDLTTDAERAVSLAAELLEEARKLQTPQERRQQAELDRMIGHVEDKATLVEMTDQAFRTHSPARVADQLTHLLDVQGIPRFFSPVEQAMLKGFQSFGEYLPGVAVPLVKEKMRRETANVILPAEPKLLGEHLRNRQTHGMHMNVNLLGEAILGEQEARRRVDQCYDALRMNDLKCLSVKISTLYSQISPIARRHSIDKVADRLEALYRIALNKADPVTKQSKFVYLDMEEYRDLYLTADILCNALDRESMLNVSAGIALQAYVPDSFDVMMRLVDWSRQRVAQGGQPLTIRLVKGANLEMERVDASIQGWPQAPYRSKVETDANYKSMLRVLIDGAAEGVIRVGVASHNLFDVALALLWSADQNATQNVQFEMLEGMANHQRRAISERDNKMVLYAPACFQDSFINAIAYLIRRLDENTGPENFLRHTYRLTPDSEEFAMLAQGFKDSLAMIDTVSHTPRRTQDRRVKPEQPVVAEDWTRFVNEPDTDWSLPHNAQWIESVLRNWKDRCDTLDTGSGEVRESTDPSRPEVVVCRYSVPTLADVETAVETATAAQSEWGQTSLQHRHDLLRRVAQNLRERRGDLIAAMVADGGKTVLEADPEVSEAIDFCEFYPLTVDHWHRQSAIKLEPRGNVAVVTPWNFPLAIPCGGIAAALAAGNCVLLKPASETVLVAWHLCQAFWDAGVPKDVLQFLPCAGRVAEAGLVKNPQIETVILTGGTSTAKRMLSVRSDLHLLAETGGKNATIVTSMADRDLAVKHVVQSAFGHSGQKCSATSLLLLENDVFDDKTFREMLADAVSSIRVGSSWDLSTKMGPLIKPPQAELNQGLKSLEDDESWLVIPEHIVDNPNLYRPGVKWNIRPGSFTHLTELFGPVLGVMRFSRLEEAIEIVRSTGYGLTSGLESLDDREITLWRDSVHAGNLYINRPTTGAIVLRQPFGGVGLSAYGPGVKAGGPHYVLPLMRVTDGKPAVAPTSHGGEKHVETFEYEELDRLNSLLERAVNDAVVDDVAAARIQAAAVTQRVALENEFSSEHDTFRLIGQDNIRRYRPTQAMNLRFDANDSISDIWISLSAAITVKTQVTLSIDPEVSDAIKDLLERIADIFPGLVHPIDESESELVERISAGDVGRLRLVGSTKSNKIDDACAESFVTVIREPVLVEGAVECLRYLDEQSISHDYHRYGNPGRRAGEKRAEVL